MIKGYPDQKKIDEGAPQFGTVQPVREQQFAADMVAHAFAQLIASDAAEAGSTNRIIVATGHSALVGDIISWTSGALNTKEFRALAVAADSITVAEEMSTAPSVADTFSILRQKVATVSASGGLSVSATLTNDTNYGVVGANTLRTAAQIGNATGAADFGSGVVGAQVLRTTPATNSPHLLATRHEAAATPLSTRPSNGTNFADFGSGALSAATPRVVLATDQPVIPVSDNGGSLTVDGTVDAVQSGVWETRIFDSNGVAISSDGNNLNVNVQASSFDFATENTLSDLNNKVVQNFGDSTQGIRTATFIGNENGPADFNHGAVGAQTFRTVSVLSNGSAAAAYGSGAVSSETLRVVLPTDQPTVPVLGQGRSKVELIRNVHSSVNVTTGAYVQLVASTSAIINKLWCFDSSGSALFIATGAAAAEVDRFYIPPGGLTYPMELNIPAGTRISVKAVDTDATTGQLLISAMS